jgi:hypothetical protein
MATLAVTLSVLVASAAAQEQNAPQQKKTPITASARLAAAKTAFVKYAGGSSIPYRVVSSAMEGWGQFTLVDRSDKADIIVEVSAPDTDSGVSVSGSSKPSSSTGRMEESTTTSRQLSTAPVKMLVYDARSKLPLWSATEQPKFAVKQKTREDNLVDAAQQLMTKFREQVELQMHK